MFNLTILRAVLVLLLASYVAEIFAFFVAPWYFGALFGAYLALYMRNAGGLTQFREALHTSDMVLMFTVVVVGLYTMSM